MQGDRRSAGRAVGRVGKNREDTLAQLDFVLSHVRDELDLLAAVVKLERNLRGPTPERVSVPAVGPWHYCAARGPACTFKGRFADSCLPSYRSARSTTSPTIPCGVAVSIRDGAAKHPGASRAAGAGRGGRWTRPQTHLTSSCSPLFCLGTWNTVVGDVTRTFAPGPIVPAAPCGAARAVAEQEEERSRTMGLQTSVHHAPARVKGGVRDAAWASPAEHRTVLALVPGPLQRGARMPNAISG